MMNTFDWTLFFLTHPPTGRGAFVPPCPELKRTIHRQKAPVSALCEITASDIPLILAELAKGRTQADVALDFNTVQTTVSLIHRGLHSLQTRKQNIKGDRGNSPWRTFEHREQENK